MASDARQLLLANKWDEAKDPTGFWMSEKLDGVRGYWSGSTFYSRQGNEFKAPAWFTKDLPKEPLDGELWCGRNLFQKTLSIVKSQKKSNVDEWKYVTYLVFDAPKHGGKYEERVEWLKKHIPAHKNSCYAAVVGIQRCEGLKNLKTVLQKVLVKGGEGLMLREPGSLYEHCRSNSLLKVKYFHDEEARVTAVLPGSGRCQNMMGKLACELPNGITFHVGTGFSDAMRKKPPQVGSIITFKYQECSDTGTPRFPVFLHERPELTWTDVCTNSLTKPEWSQLKHVKPELKRQHSILFCSAVPSRDASGTKIVTTDDENSDDDQGKDHGKPSKQKCKYGAACYQRSADHLAKYSHEESKSVTAKQHPAAGTVDASVREVTKAAASASHKTPCTFGSNCFRKNAAHLEKYFHPAEVTVSEDAIQLLKRKISIGKVNLNDYFNLGVSEDEISGIEDESSEVPNKKRKV